MNIKTNEIKKKERKDMRKALELTVNLWEFLADNGYNKKCHHKSYGMYLKMPGICPLCELIESREYGCKGCPLHSAGIGCNTWKSPWKKWNYSTNKITREINANIILCELESALKDINRNVMSRFFRRVYVFMTTPIKIC